MGSIFSVAPSIKLDINRHSTGQELLGKFDKVTLNNNSEDPSRLMQAVFYKLFEWADYPASRCNLANVTINGEALGVYSNVERLDERFLMHNFGNSSGSLYECQLTDFRMYWVNRWESKTLATDDSKERISKIAYVLENANEEQLLAELDDYVNIENFLRFWALEIILNHVDGYGRNSNNTYVYFDPDDNNRATFIPAGINYFQEENMQGTPLKEFMTAELPRRLSRCRGIDQRLEDEINYLLDNVWDEQALHALIDHFEVQVLNAQLDLDPENGFSQNYLPSLKKWVSNRKQRLRATIAASGIPTGNSTPSKRCYFEES